MNNRLLFPNTVLPKRYVVERLIENAMMIYADHPVYTFDANDLETNILIAPTYANTNQSDKKPKLLFQGGGYNFGRQNSLDKNFMQEITDDDNHVIGKRHNKRIRMQVMVMVQAFLEEECSDMADEFAMLCGAQAAHVFSNTNVDIVDIEVSETNVLDQDNKSFQTIVTIQVESQFTIDDLPIPEGPIDFGTDIDIPQTGNRAPGVEVYFKSRQWE